MNLKNRFKKGKPDLRSWAKAAFVLTTLAALSSFAVAEGDSAGNAANLWIEKGDELFENGSYEEALDALNNATDIDPQNAMAWLTKASILGPKLGRYNESLEACDEAIHINPDDADAWRLRGVILMNLRRPAEEALAAFDEAIELDPLNAFMWIEKGNVLLEMGSYEEAFDAYDEATEIDPENGSLWKGRILMEFGRFEDALECFNRSIEANPESAEAWYWKAAPLIEMSMPEEALFALNKTIELDPEDPNAWLDKGGILRALGREDEAEMAITTSVEIHENAIEQNPNDFDAWYRKGLAHYTLGEYEEAVLSFDEAIELGADFGRLWYYKCLALQALGRETDAAFTRARELGYGDMPALSLAITNFTSVGEDKFVELINNRNKTITFTNLALIIDEKEKVILPDFTLDPGERIRFHFGDGESNEDDVFLNVDLALDVTSNLRVRNEITLSYEATI